MAELLHLGIGFFGMMGPDAASTPDHPIPEVQSTPAGDPLGDFGMQTGYPNQTTDAVESRRFQITAGSATGQDPGPKRNHDF